MWIRSIAFWIGLVATAAGGLAAMGCGGVPARVPEREAGVALRPPERPVLELPPPPRRGPDHVWTAALARARRLEPVVEQDIRSVSPPPIPEALLRPSRPEARSPAAPPARKAEKPPEPTGSDAPLSSRPAVPEVRVVQRYTTDNGLPSNRVTAIYVDESDAWVGTADAGVARLNFAEGNWIITNLEDGLASNRVSDIIKYKGLVLVGTQDGISIWDGASWRIKTRVGKVKLINTVFTVHEGLLWVAARTMHGGLLTFDGERWRDKSTIKPGTVLNNVSDFAFSDGVLWIGTTNRGVYRFDGKRWKTFTVADGIASNFVYTLAVKGERCYLGGCCGVSVYENGAWKIYDIAEGLPHSTVNAIAVDGDLVWFGSKKGLGLFDGFEFTNFYTEDGLTDDRITSLFVRGQEVWVGTANGLNRLEKVF